MKARLKHCWSKNKKREAYYYCIVFSFFFFSLFSECLKQYMARNKDHTRPPAFQFSALLQAVKKVKGTKTKQNKGSRISGDESQVLIFSWKAQRRHIAKHATPRVLALFVVFFTPGASSEGPRPQPRLPPPHPPRTPGKRETKNENEK